MDTIPGTLGGDKTLPKNRQQRRFATLKKYIENWTLSAWFLEGA